MHSYLNIRFRFLFFPGEKSSSSLLAELVTANKPQVFYLIVMVLTSSRICCDVRELTVLLLNDQSSNKPDTQHWFPNLNHINGQGRFVNSCKYGRVNRTMKFIIVLQE